MEIKEPFVMMLIGPTLSGKTSWIRKNFPDINVISRDEIVMEVANTRDYNLAFKTCDQKLVDRILNDRFKFASEMGISTIVDMTNLGSKRRKSTINQFGDNFLKVAITFPVLTIEEYGVRNNNRNESENKWIPPSVIESMINSYEYPTLDEGFDIISNAYDQE